MNTLKAKKINGLAFGMRTVSKLQQAKINGGKRPVVIEYPYESG